MGLVLVQFAYTYICAYIPTIIIILFHSCFYSCKHKQIIILPNMEAKLYGCITNACIL